MAKHSRVPVCLSSMSRRGRYKCRARFLLRTNRPARKPARHFLLHCAAAVEVRVPRRGRSESSWRQFAKTLSTPLVATSFAALLTTVPDPGPGVTAGNAWTARSPLRIECYDISNTGGNEIVASMVVLEDGLPKPRDYRRFKIRDQAGQDDFAAMAEVVRRRFTAYLEETREPVASESQGSPDTGAESSTKLKKFAYRPNLLLIDGGPGQLNAALRVLGDLGVEGIAVAGLAKKFEEVYLPGQAEPIRIERGSDALHILQRVRDEAHRFAISYHRKLRGKKMTRSALDEIAGVGEVRKKLLMRHFGSVKRLRGRQLTRSRPSRGSR